LQRGLACEGHDACVTQLHGPLGFAGIGMFADRDKLTLIFEKPSIARRIGGAESQHGQRRSILQCPAHALECRGVNQRRIAESNEQIVRACFNHFARRQHGMRRSEPFALNIGLGPGRTCVTSSTTA
jgi:hypothetical protein